MAWMVALAFHALPAIGAEDPVCPADKPLGGHVVLQYRESDEDHSRTGRLRTWFQLFPAAEKGLTYRAQPWFAKGMTWRIDTSPCADKPDPGNVVCGCKPIRSDGKITFDPTGKRPEFHALFPRLYVPIPAEVSSAMDARDFRCANEFGSSESTKQLARHFPEYLMAPTNPFEQSHVRVDATGCLDEDEAMTPECAKAIKKFAAIPFTGTGRIEETPTLETRVQWEVCCGCGEPPAADFEGEKDPCGDASQQRGLLEVAVALSEALRADLKTRVERFTSNREQAETYRSDFQLVSNSCAGWDISMALLSALIGGAGAPKGAGALSAADQAAQAAAAAFTQVLELLEKIAEGDPEVILSGVEGAEVDLLGVEGFTFGSLWGPASEIYKLVADAQNPSSIANMRSRLEDCAGTPLVSDLVYDDAKKFLDFSEAAAGELPGIQQLTTRIQQADTTTYERWVAWYNACRQEAVCRGTDPEECQPEP